MTAAAGIDTRGRNAGVALALSAATGSLLRTTALRSRVVSTASAAPAAVEDAPRVYRPSTAEKESLGSLMD